MNLFKAHNQVEDDSKAKQLMRRVVITNVHNYVLAQKDLMELLGKNKIVEKCSKKKKCTLCKIESIMSYMGNCQRVTSDACKSYNLMFGEDIDLRLITERCRQEVFKQKRVKDDTGLDMSKGYIIPEDAPDDVVAVCEAIKSALGEKGFDGMQMEVINTQDYNFGLKQDDFDNFGEFAKAVSEARRLNGKTGEEVLTDAVIKTAEKASETPADKTKLN